MNGGAVRQPTGKILTYRESVHHHVVSSMANLTTLRANRQEILADFLEQSRAAIAITEQSPARVFLLRPGHNPTRYRVFLETLHNQGIEIYQAMDAFRVESATDTFRQTHETLELPAGTSLIPVKQPAGALAAMVTS